MENVTGLKRITEDMDVVYKTKSVVLIILRFSTIDTQFSANLFRENCGISGKKSSEAMRKNRRFCLIHGVVEERSYLQ